MRSLKHVIFDLDGVIIDTLPTMRKAFFIACEHLKIPNVNLRFEVFIQMQGAPIDYIMARAELPAAFKQRYYEEFDAIGDGVKMFDRMPEIISGFRRENLCLSIATGKFTERATTILERLGLAGYFEIIAGGNCVYRGKPEPEVIYYIMSKTGYEPENSLMIGDSPLDIQCALNSGVYPVGASWAQGNTFELANAGAERIFDTPSGFSEFVLGRA